MPILIIDSSDDFPSAIHSETIKLPVTVDLNVSVPTRFLKDDCRLLADDEEVGIIYYSYDKGGVGTECRFTLADFSQRNVIKNAEVFTFQLSTDGGVTWVTKADNQVLKSWSIGADKDTFSFQTIDGLASNLSRCPSQTLVMYNPDNSPFDPTAVEVKKDNIGNEYPIESISNSNLTLGDVLDEIIINRCEIASYFSDIPLDTPIDQITFEMGVPYLEALKGKIGEYEPTFEIIGGVLEIRDSTLPLSEGAPTPPDLTIERCLDYSIDAEESDADMVELTFTSTSAEHDFITERPKVFVEQVEEESTGNMLTTNVIQYIHEYRNSLLPLVVQQEEIQNDFRDTTRSPGAIHESTKQITKFYDKFHRLVTTRHQEDTRVPDPDNEGGFIFQEEEWFESQDVEYAQHPFNPGESYQKKVTRRSKGLVVKDEGNPYGWDKESGAFTQGFRNAHRSGNIPADFSYLTGRSLETHTESFAPKKNGQVDYRYEAYDNVRGTPIKTIDTPRTGALGLNSNNGEPQTIYVLPEGVSEKGTGKRVPLSVNGPARYGIPLAQRWLKKWQTAPGNATLSIAGIRLDVKKGRPFSVTDKLEQLEGIFLVKSYSGEGKTGQSGMVHTMKVNGSEIPFVRDEIVSAYVIALGSTESKIFTRQIKCWSGYKLSSEVVADVTVEARKLGDSVWINLESSFIDLDAYADTTQTFQFRLTAGTVSAFDEKTFNLVIEPA